MPEIEVSAHTTVPPETFVAALTDFGADRLELWGNSESKYYKVHELGSTHADVTEGSGVLGGIWQRYRYDWSRPGVVRLEVLDSNAFGQGSFWEYQVHADTAGGAVVRLHIRRVPTTLKGRIVNVLLLPAGRWFFRRDLRKTIKRIERHRTRTVEGPKRTGQESPTRSHQPGATNQESGGTDGRP